MYLGGDAGLVVPGLLVFYGLALLNASKYTLMKSAGWGSRSSGWGWWPCCCRAGAWRFALGFGLGHIGYGLRMYHRYERPGPASARRIRIGPVKHLIHTLNKAFDHRVRLGVMAVLLATDAVSFNDLKEVLDLTDGNLASHVAALEKAGYVLVSKQFIGKATPPTCYRRGPRRLPAAPGGSGEAAAPRLHGAAGARLGPRKSFRPAGRHIRA
ncbi:MAG: transcriptional regulator [Hymenobacter sp.]